MSSIRPATHSGSWYEANPARLKRQIQAWITAARNASSSGLPKELNHAVESNPRFGVGPHAGYTYCGHVLANTYTSISPQATRVFIMGPSHHVYYRGVKTTAFKSYETPVGNLDVDTQLVQQLISEAGLGFLSYSEDCDEHALEMHCPFLRETHPNPDLKIVPLLFGSVDSKAETKLLKALAPYFADESTAFVVSSDFCHWGRSFGYMASISESGEFFERVPRDTPDIWKGIRSLDYTGMEIATEGSSADWVSYIERTGNTVCGQRPLLTLLRLGEKNSHPLHFNWLAYDQSSQVTRDSQTSVSYAAGVAS